MSERTFDITVFGATGFTGRLVAEYLAKHAPKGTRWALAGRNAKALGEIRASLEASKPPCPPTGVVVASITDQQSLTQMAAGTRVVLTTVGPYLEYGEPVVRACVEEGADYVDITGEPDWTAAMVEKYDAAAREKKLRIVSCCGFDSIPHDLGTLFTVNRLPEGVALTVDGFVRANGVVSGGTWRTVVQTMASFGKLRREKAKRRNARTGDAPARKVSGSKAGVRYSKDLSCWAVPMPTVDPLIVLRSARDLDRYGPSFRYGHFARVKRITTVIGVGMGLMATFALAQLPPTRALLLKANPAGNGPNEAARAKGWFNVTFVGEGGGRRVVTEVSGGDPGYGETAKMVAESALALALDREKLPQRFGVITTAVAMGTVLIDRLTAAGIGFRIVREELIDASATPQA